MHHLKSMFHAAYRLQYVLTMFLGVRACVNHARSWLCVKRPRATALDGSLLRSERLGDLRVFVHPRLRPREASEPAHHGVISLRQRQPTVRPWLYRYLCLTSHFGCAHVEIAFYEQADEVTIYGVRNIAKSNAHRVGLLETARYLQLARRDEARILLREVASFLEGHGLVTKIAAPCECVTLSVRKSLLHPASQAEALDALRRKYERLQDLTGGRSGGQ